MMITVKYVSRITRMDQIIILIESIEIGSHGSTKTIKSVYNIILEKFI